MAKLSETVIIWSNHPETVSVAPSATGAGTAPVGLLGPYPQVCVTPSTTSSWYRTGVVSVSRLLSTRR